MYQVIQFVTKLHPLVSLEVTIPTMQKVHFFTIGRRCLLAYMYGEFMRMVAWILPRSVRSFELQIQYTTEDWHGSSENTPLEEENHLPNYTRFLFRCTKESPIVNGPSRDSVRNFLSSDITSQGAFPGPTASFSGSKLIFGGVFCQLSQQDWDEPSISGEEHELIIPHNSWPCW